MNNSSQKLIVVLSIISSVLFVLVLVLLYSNIQKTQISSQSILIQTSPTPTRVEDSVNKQYENRDLGLKFKYSDKYSLQENIQNTFTQLYVEDIFNLKVDKSFLKDQLNYYMDTGSTSETTINGTTWKVFKLEKNDYNEDIIAFQTVKNQYLYSISFLKTTTLNSEQKQILSSIEFVKPDNGLTWQRISVSPEAYQLSNQCVSMQINRLPALTGSIEDYLKNKYQNDFRANSDQYLSDKYNEFTQAPTGVGDAGTIYLYNSTKLIEVLATIPVAEGGENQTTLNCRDFDYKTEIGKFVKSFE